MSFNPTPFLFWEGLLHWAIVFGAFALIVLAVGLLTSLIVGGRRGFGLFSRQLGEGAVDTVRMSPRRVWALSVLTFREAVRRKTLLIFVVFALLFMFAGWFLSNNNPARPDLQIKVYVSLVMTAITWLVLPVVLLLSCWGLPQDIKDRSLHTVVTKPVRRSEVVLGRILGFAGVGTLILGIMAVVGYFWIERNFPEPTRTETVAAGEAEYKVTAQLGPQITARVANVKTGAVETFSAPNTLELRGRVAARAGQDGPLPRELPRKVEQVVQALQQSNQAVLVSRVPVYGQLSFTDREGNPGKGINVGDVWEFRGYIEGATKASGLYEFEGVSPEAMGDSLVLDSHFEAFRTHKGKMGQGLQVEFRLLNDLRAQTAAALAAVTGFEQVKQALENGEFVQAGQELETAAHRLETDEVKLTADQYRTIAVGYRRFAEFILPPLIRKHPDADALPKLQQAARAVADAAQQAAGPQKAQQLEDALVKVAALLSENGAALAELLTDTVVPVRSFEIQEFRGNQTIIPRELRYYDAAGGEHRVDLYDDLVHGDTLRVRVVCLDPGQFLGMARPDLFIRSLDKPFASGYFKAVLGIWLMMVLIIVLGVTASTFVKGPVATLLVFTLLILGVGFHGFMDQLLGESTGQRMEGGFGTLESAIRLVRHLNPYVGMEEGTSAQVIKTTDEVILGGIWLVYKIVPNFNNFRMSEYVANGFDVPWNAALLPAAATTLAFLIPCLILGYYSLKLRELEAK